MAMRMADWQLRVVLPALAYVARTSPAPNRDLDACVAELVVCAQRRGLRSVLAQLERDVPRGEIVEDEPYVPAGAVRVTA